MEWIYVLNQAKVVNNNDRYPSNIYCQQVLQYRSKRELESTYAGTPLCPKQNLKKSVSLT